MRIDSLTVKNFKGFDCKELHFRPGFNLIIGRNGTGKTSVLDALSVAVGSWFLGLRGPDVRHIRPGEVLLRYFEHGEGGDGDVQWERMYPCKVSARGSVQNQSVEWSRSLNAPGRRTTGSRAIHIKQIAAAADQAVRNGQEILLPLISYYGTDRLWQESRKAYSISDPTKIASKEEQSRMAGYWDSTDPRLSVDQLTQWIARQSWIAYQQKNRVPPVFGAIREALVACVDDAREIYFDAKLGEVVVQFSDGTSHPFSDLSDGQRCMLAMVGDIAQKAAKLNPHLGHQVLQETPGVVLIDELDLHLHPQWQRHVIEDLRRSFPKIQFICTTHSPFLIQSLRPGELINLDPDERFPEYSDRSIEDIAEEVMRVDVPQKSRRFVEMTQAAEEYFRLLRDGGTTREDVDTAERRLDELSDRYSDNPAFVALLKLEREAARKGESNATG